MGKKSLAPQLPPHLVPEKKPDLAAKSGPVDTSHVSSVVDELNSCPFFMTQYDIDNGTENESVEALKALAYEGEPIEVATNFKNHGNEQFKVKHYKDAIEFYTKGINVKCGDKAMETSLRLNRAQSQLCLKNYRKCITDCQEVLKISPESVKAYYKMAKSFLAINRYRDAIESSEFCLKNCKEITDAQRQDFAVIVDKARAEDQKVLDRKAKRDAKYDTMVSAVAMRGTQLVFTEKIAKENVLILEDPQDPESQFVFECVVDFPDAGVTSVLSDVLELTPLEECAQSAILTEPEKFAGHSNKYNYYVETAAGGLAKVGKKKTFFDLLSLPSPKIVMKDMKMFLYVVEKSTSEKFLQNWNKDDILDKRVAEKSVNEVFRKYVEMAKKDE